MTWVLHHESDMQNYAAYGQANGNHIEANFNAKPVSTTCMYINMIMAMELTNYQ